jgi:hypothetical protein
LAQTRDYQGERGMPGRIANWLATIVSISCGLAAAALPFDASRAQTAQPLECGSDLTVRICVRSAAVTPTGYLYSYNIRASIILEISNISEYPIDVFFVNDPAMWSFTPRNGEVIAGSIEKIAGIGTCQVCEGTDYYGHTTPATTLSPGLRARVSVVVLGSATPSAIALIQEAPTGSLSGQILVIDRGKRRYMPIAIDEFSFGNGLVEVR